MRFISLEKSNKPEKKYVIKFSEPSKTIHFGSKNSSTYLDHKDIKIRENYLKRHAVLEDWNKIGPGSLSAIILWGRTTDLNKNLKYYLNKFDIK
jgi:hypothetical protein